MKTLSITILSVAALAGLASVATASAAEARDVLTPAAKGESGDSARIMRAVEAAGSGGIVWFPRGEYEIDAMLVVSNSASLLLHKSAHLKAVREMPNGAGELVWRDNYTLKFSAEEMAGLSAKLDKVISSDAATSPNLAGDGD